jgi:hypothetical protein
MEGGIQEMLLEEERGVQEGVGPAVREGRAEGAN